MSRARMMRRAEKKAYERECRELKVTMNVFARACAVMARSSDRAARALLQFASVYNLQAVGENGEIIEGRRLGLLDLA